MGDLIGIQLFPRGERAGWTPPDLPDHRAQVLADDELPELLMGQMERREEVVVEEVAERAVADVVHERGDSKE